MAKTRENQMKDIGWQIAKKKKKKKDNAAIC